jgi:hypothetical protein
VTGTVSGKMPIVRMTSVSPSQLPAQANQFLALGVAPLDPPVAILLKRTD